jgi:methionyl-tRNA formyltransferase
LLATPEWQVVGVVTQPDRPKGRDLQLQPSPVKVAAVAANLPVLQPQRAREESFIRDLADLQPELIVVAAFGQILPTAILDLPRHGCLNVHTSLLPRYRGAAPIQWALLNDETETGVTIMKMDAGMDTGDILTQATTPVRPEDNSQTLHDRLARLGAELLVQTIPDFVAGRIAPKAQPQTGVSYAPKIKKQDGQIDWNQPARMIWNRIRGLVPWPGAFTRLATQPQRQVLKLWAAEVLNRAGSPGEVLQADKEGVVIGCGTDALRVLELQREGGRRLPAREFLAGHPLNPGERFA